MFKSCLTDVCEHSSKVLKASFLLPLCDIHVAHIKLYTEIM